MNWMKVSLAALTLSLAPARADHADWYDHGRVVYAAQELEQAVADFGNRLATTPGTFELRRINQAVHQDAFRFSRSVQANGGSDVDAILAEFRHLGDLYEQVRAGVRRFQLQEGSQFLSREFFRVLEAFHRLAYWLTPAAVTPGPGPGPSPTPAELKDSFVESTGYLSPSQSDFDQAANRARAACNDWKSQVTQGTAGRVLLSQCSGAARVTAADGKIGAQVNGTVSIGFENLKGIGAPKTVTFPVVVSTGYLSPSESDVAQASKAAADYCKTSLQESRQLSKGVFLYSYCGGAKRVTAFDGKVGYSVEAVASVGWQGPVSSSQTVNETFQVTTGYLSPSQSDLSQAATSALSECRRWAKDLLAGSSAEPAFVLCAGPSVVKASKIDVAYQGTATLVLP
jgi:hypothetical protein